MRRVLPIAFALLAVVAFAAPAQAAFILTLAQGGSSVSVADGDLADLNLAAGGIATTADIGDYSISLTTASSEKNPPFGPQLQITTLTVVNVGDLDLTNDGDPLVITLSDTDFSFPLGFATEFSSLSGTWNSTLGGSGTVSFTSYADPDNCQSGIPGDACGGANAVATGTTSFAVLPNQGAGSSPTSIGTPVTFLNSGLYSITNITTISLTRNNVSLGTTGTTTITQVPEPGALALLSVGLFGLAGVVRRRRSRR